MPLAVSPGYYDLVLDLTQLHERIHAVPRLVGVQRIAVAIYDAKTDQLRTFIDSSGGKVVLRHYAVRLKDVPSLAEVARLGRPRVVNDTTQYDLTVLHSRRVFEQGMRSSYTIPLARDGALRGFLFFNAAQPDFFTPEILELLWPYAQTAIFIAMMELDKVRLIQAALNTVLHISRHRDEETGAHLERMSRYVRLIAESVADSHGLADAHIEYIHAFSRLHDIGKVAVPDSILLKPGPLTPQEFAMMQEHVAKGEDIVNTMMRGFAVGDVPQVHILRNIVSYHHEAWDGSGYPYGLEGLEIPLEGRITAVADVFDALTSNRPYKAAWTNEEAFGYLRQMRGRKFYPPCVDALLLNRVRIEEIQSRFGESAGG